MLTILVVLVVASSLPPLAVSASHGKAKLSYTVKDPQRITATTPMFNYPSKTTYNYTYNPSYVTITLDDDASEHRPCLAVRCQVAEKDENGYDETHPGPSVITATCGDTLDNSITNNFAAITPHTVIVAPSQASDKLGTEDPRLNYVGGRYLMFYTAVEPFRDGQVSARLALASCDAPGQECFLGDGPSGSNKWTKHGALLPDDSKGFQFTKSGALLVGNSAADSMLIFGDCSIENGLQVALPSEDFLSYKLQPGLIFEKRPGMWDGGLIESGPAPLRLPTGDWFFIYNAAQKLYGVPNQFFYNPGYVILNGSNPWHVLQRSELPLMMPVEDWETAGLTPYVVFIEGMRYESAEKEKAWRKHLESVSLNGVKKDTSKSSDERKSRFHNWFWPHRNPHYRVTPRPIEEPPATKAQISEHEESFIVYYGGADTAVGAARIVVSW